MADSKKYKIHVCLKNLTDLLNIDNIHGFDSSYIAKKLNIHRTSISRELNSLFRENKIIKIIGKPVLFLDKDILEKKFKVIIKENLYLDIESLISVIRRSRNHFINGNIKIINEKKNKKNFKSFQEKESSDIENDENIFAKMIGWNDSLKEPIAQAKAAILYPPNGLHTLLLGPTGVGKTTFAELMHKYSIKVETLKENAPYIIFNCADYSNNPQLLISQLFGHIKGAFTGADREKKGIIDSADGGILFLDEIHRLPSEGQEMLFSLIDRGTFRRLGESNSIHKARVLIVAATTENINENILSTFLRRIPCIINIPSLLERSINDRLRLIVDFFSEEARKIKFPITISKEVLKVLLIYECPGNIGQLKNDIKLLSANAFAETVISKKNNIFIDLIQLSKRFKNILMNISEASRIKFDNYIDMNEITEITFDTNKDANSVHLENILTDCNYKAEEFYENILEKSRKYFEEGKSIDVIKRKISTDIDRYLDVSKNSNSELITKIVSKNVLDVTIEIFEEIKCELKFETDRKMIYSLALHVETLISRIKSGNKICSSPMKMDNMSTEYTLAKKIKEKLEKKLKLNIPNEEAIIISMFLSAIKESKREEYVGILVIAHGESTATSMADVANKLLEVNHANAIDMPLSESVNNIFIMTLEKVKMIDRGKGVLLLVDMGSLTAFGEIITEKTGIQTRVVKMVTTPMVIEATRKAMMPNIELDILIREVNSMSRYIGKSIEEPNLQLDIKVINSFRYEESDFLSSNRERIIEMLEETVSFLNVKKTYIILNEILNNISNDLNIVKDDSLVIKFLFHCTSMVERIIRDDSLEYKNYLEVKYNKYELFKVLKINFKPIENSFGISIPESELCYIVELVDIHIEPEPKLQMC